MTYIGNDIIDLNCPENRKSFHNSRYLNKFLTASEINYCKGKNYLYPYIFWTCKESCYKILLKKGLNKSFSPRKFQVNLLSFDQTITSIVKYENFSCAAYSTISNSHFIHTIATNNKSIKSLIQFSIFNINESPIDQIAEIINISPNFLTINKKNGIPILKYKNMLIPYDISISHDGDFYSFAVLKQE